MEVSQPGDETEGLAAINKAQVTVLVVVKVIPARVIDEEGHLIQDWTVE